MRVINFEADTWYARIDEGSPREDALRIADAMGRLVRDSQPGATVYIGYDARQVSSELAREMGELIAGYGACARVSSSHCPEPALCEATRQDPRAFAALMISAGVRSADYIGVRVRMSDGSKASSSDIDVLESLVGPTIADVQGEVELYDLMTPYLEGIASVAGSIDSGGEAPLVVCDPMYGAMTSHAARLLTSMGARVVELHGDFDPDLGGLHPMAAEPWIDDCEQAVQDSGACFGVALDGAGNRLALVDERGRLVTPHVMLSIIMQYLVKVRGMSGRMVAPIFVSTVVRRQAERLGLPLTVTAAGYMWMREEMAAGDVVCAGDALGGICMPCFGLERDGLAAAALLLRAIVEDGRPLSKIVEDLSSELGHMDYGRRDVRMGSGAVQVLRNALPGVNPPEIAGRVPVEVSHPGGLMARFGDGSWLLVLPSRDVGLASVYAEAPDPASRDELLAAGASIALSPLS